MESLFTIFAIVYIVLALPVPPPASGAGATKMIVGLAGIVLLVLILLGLVPHHG